MPETETRMSPVDVIDAVKKELDIYKGAGERENEAARLEKENGELEKEIREVKGEMGIPPGSEEDPDASDGEEGPEAEECYQARTALPDHAETSGESADRGERARAVHRRMMMENENPTLARVRSQMQEELTKEEVQRLCEVNELPLYEEFRLDVDRPDILAQLEEEAKQKVSDERRNPEMDGKTLSIGVMAMKSREKSGWSCARSEPRLGDWRRVYKGLLKKREIVHEHVRTRSGRRISRLKVVDPSSLRPPVPEDADTWERLRAKIKHPKLFSGDWHTIYLAEFTIVTETPRETRLRIIGR